MVKIEADKLSFQNQKEVTLSSCMITLKMVRSILCGFPKADYHKYIYPMHGQRVQQEQKSLADKLNTFKWTDFDKHLLIISVGTGWPSVVLTKVRPKLNDLAHFEMIYY